MSFRRYLGLAGLAFATCVAAQGEAEPPVATITPIAEPEAVELVELTDAHGPAEPGDAQAGAGKAAVCSACHGMDGNAADPQYPKLAGQNERFTARQLALFKSGERDNPIMMAFAAPLSPQDMRDLGAYFAGQQVLPGLADDTPVTEGQFQGRRFFEIGQALYRGGDSARAIPACLSCHGPAGEGNPGPAYPALAGQHAAYTAAQLRAFRGGLVLGAGDQANSVMSGVAGKLTDQEIEALSTYIEGLHSASALQRAGTTAAR